jgi:hypothetical protein
MSKYVIDSATLTDIADAIREKTLTTGAIAPGDMPAFLKKYSKRDWLLINKTMREYDADNPWQVYDMIDFGDMTTIPAYACYGSSVDGYYNGVSGQQVTWIREQAFRGRDTYFPNSYLATIDFPKLERIDKEAFSQCLFTTLTIPECVIGERAFASCTDLATMTFTPKSDENSLTVGAYAFSGCSSLTTVNFADHKIAQISEHAFDGAGLTTVTVPPVHNWEDYAFANCQGLTTVYIKGCADWMQFLPTSSPPGTHTFTGCDALKDIYVTWGEDPDWGAPWGATNATVHYNWAG